MMILSIAITPLYIKYMGAESYGLIGFFVLAQMWLNILDVGISPTLGRQLAYARGKKNGFQEFQKLLKSFEMFFIFLATLNFIIIFFSSTWISNSWINAESLSPNIIWYSIVIMGIIISLRWFQTMYKSGLNGFEDQVWLNKFNIISSTFKYIVALFIIIFISSNIEDFFTYQLIIAILECIFLNMRFYKLLSFENIKLRLFYFDMQAVKSIIPFAFTIAYTTIIWTFLMQLDKLLLSGILSLKDFGYLSIVTLISNGLIALSSPVFLAVVPRLTKLFSENKNNEMILMYRNMTQLVSCLVIPISLIICIYSKEVIYLLTGDVSASLWGAEVLPWFILGYGVYVLGTFQYYLQNIFGDLTIYTKALSLGAIIYIPILYIVTVHYQVKGAAIIWLIFTVVWFLLITYIVHKKFIKEFHKMWMIKDIVPILFISILSIFIYSKLFSINISDGKLFILIKLCVITCLITPMALLSISKFRMKIKTVISGKRDKYE